MPHRAAAAAPAARHARTDGPAPSHLSALMIQLTRFSTRGEGGGALPRRPDRTH
jgi:hypothetical protein